MCQVFSGSGGDYVKSRYGVLAVLLVFATAGCARGEPLQVLTPSAPSGSATTPAETPSAASADACHAMAASMTREEQAGQVVMMGVTDNLDASERKALEATPFGSVLLLGQQGEGSSRIRSRTEAIMEYAGAGGMLVAVDQEGGRVQRITGSGFDTIPSAQEQSLMAEDELAGVATAWGGQLAESGILLNLAPVADVVPESKQSSNQPIGALARGYGSDPVLVADHVTAFIEGMHAAGVATSVKHFPGLGEVEGNTDHTGNVVDTDTTATSANVEPFRAAIEAGTETVMVSTAVYEQIDPDHRAAFSATVMGLLRDDLDFDKVIISDDLGAAQSVADVPKGERAVLFVGAGGDLAISADPGTAEAMVASLSAEADADSAFGERLTESAGRVLALKRGLGIVTCEAG